MTLQALETLLRSEASSSKLSLRLAAFFSAVMSVCWLVFWWYKTLTRTTWPLSASEASDCQVNTITLQSVGLARHGEETAIPHPGPSSLAAPAGSARLPA